MPGSCTRPALGSTCSRSARSTRSSSRTRRSWSRATSSPSSTRSSTTRSRLPRSSRARRSGATWAGLPGSGNLFGALRKADWTTRPRAAGSTSGAPTLRSRRRGDEALGQLRVPDREARTDRADLLCRDAARSDGLVYVHVHSAEPAGDALGARDDAQHADRQDRRAQLRRLGPLRPLERRQHRRRGRGRDHLADRRKAGPAPVDAVGRHAVVDAAHGGLLGRPGRPRLERQARLVQRQALHAGDAGRPDGRGAARRAPDDDRPGGRSVPGDVRLDRNGISEPWLYDKVPNALQTALGTWQVGTDPKKPNFDTQIGLRGHSMRTPGSAAAELRSGIDDERARRRCEDRSDPVPDQQHDRRRG